MTGKRLIAFLATVLMIVGAIAARSALDNRSSSGGSKTPSTDAPSNKGSLTVICSTEFGDACRDLGAVYKAQLNLTIEPAGKTLDRLAVASANAMPDVWITLAPFPAMLQALRTSAQLTLSYTYVAQTSPSFTMLNDRATALASDCGTTPLWGCLGKFAGEPWADHQGLASWGSIRPGLADPGSEAIGLVTLANAVAGYFNTTDFSRSDWEINQGFASWIRNLSARSKVTGATKSPLATLITQASALNVAVTDSAELSRTSRAGDAQFTTVAMAPAMTLLAQFAAFTTADADLRERVSASLIDVLITAYGWDPTSATQDPPAGTFIALRQLWKELT